MQISATIALIIALIALIFIILIVCIPKDALTIEKNISFKNTPTENVYKIWSETSLTTDIHDKAFKELDKRGYWDLKHQQSEIEAIEIYNKYK